MDTNAGQTADQGKPLVDPSPRLTPAQAVEGISLEALTGGLTALAAGGNPQTAAAAVALTAAHAAVPLIEAAVQPLEARFAAIEDHLTSQVDGATHAGMFHQLASELTAFMERLFPHEADKFRALLTKTPPA